MNSFSERPSRRAKMTIEYPAESSISSSIHSGVTTSVGMITPTRINNNMLGAMSEEDDEALLLTRRGYAPPAFSLDAIVRSPLHVTPPQTPFPMDFGESSMVDAPLSLDRSPSDDSQQSAMSMASATSCTTTVPRTTPMKSSLTGRPTHRRTETFFM
ncbi:hypothetical protein IV203_021498 [Nitzschia inconspicua]|uniref:Uncharacterized protein n=1 Tax=Nitzschia inconspicua TaxID=303405 RepID=A0A9K3KH15_9STRA|nr:hypothetical protein IV203_022696 [Nitzschia inconspicua]KAG7343553.1 hypothetical protein IV203_021498 [Nitzschia inconspicua]